MLSIKSFSSGKTLLKLSLLIILAVLVIYLFQRVFGISCFCSDDRPFPVIWWDIYQTKQKIDFQLPTYLPALIGKKHPEEFEREGAVVTHNLETTYICGNGGPLWFHDFLVIQGAIGDTKNILDEKKNLDESVSKPKYEEIVEFNGLKGLYIEDFYPTVVGVGPESSRPVRSLTLYTSKSRIELRLYQDCDIQNSKEELIKIANSLKIIKKPFLLF